MCRPSCIALPSTYSVLSLAFADEQHTFHVDPDLRPWDSKRMMQEAYYIHYSGMCVGGGRAVWHSTVHPWSKDVDHAKEH